MKIFYSWQSDSPNKTNRGFIKNALDKAARELDLELPEEAERVEVTQDTQDVPGSPEIVATILRKIRESDVFVGDVSLVGTTFDGKKLMSSNVAIELGYAMAKDADGGCLINVMNETSGTFEELPFDLRNRRKPICYTLAEEADAEEKAAQKAALVSSFKRQLKTFSAAQPAPAIPVPPPHEPILSTLHPGRYWGQGEAVYEYNDETHLHYELPQVLFVRLLPIENMPPLGWAECEQFVSKHPAPLPPMHVGTGFSPGANKYGASVSSAQIRTHWGQPYLDGVTQLFLNREIWGVDTDFFSRVNGVEEGAKRYIPISPLIKRLYNSLGHYRDAATALGYGDRLHVIFGVTNVTGYHLALGTNRFDQTEPIHADHVIIDRELPPSVSTKEVVGDFLKDLFDKYRFDEVPTHFKEELDSLP